MNSELDQFYKQIYGSRWLELKHALLNKTSSLNITPASAEPYFVDSASRFPVMALDVESHHDVLDACAAPGGKSLLIANLLQEGHLTCNELSLARLRRLRKVLETYLPEAWRKQALTVMHSNASFLGKNFPRSFDRVLLDVPCSGEKHLLGDPRELKKWTPRRTLQLSYRQLSILRSGFETLRPGGQLVYSTCSISPQENDDVIKRFLKKVKHRAMVAQDLPRSLHPHSHRLEKTEYGWQSLPDLSGMGPIYFSVIIDNGL